VTALSPEQLAALAVYAFVSSITPGPNNLMLLASGANFGFRPSIAHILGSATALTIKVGLIGFGLGQIVWRYPPIFTAIKVVGAAYILVLAWRLARAAPLTEGGSTGQGRPLSFLAAAALQFANPKGWVIATGAVATYARADTFTASAVVIALVFGAVNLPSVSVWALFGTALRRFLEEPRLLRLFNRSMALLLAGSLWPLVQDLLPR
jgi:threonine/homoserine/homoserine lactone efflux protein